MQLNYDRLEVTVRERFENFSIEIWIREKGTTSDFNINLDQGKMIKTEIEHGTVPQDDLKPFLALPHAIAGYFMDSVGGFVNKHNPKPKDANLIEGRLIATEEHLNDMRNFANKMLDAMVQSKEPVKE